MRAIDARISAAADVVVIAGTMKRSVVVFLASGAYLGYAPVASGTFGTLAGVALYPIFDRLRLWSTPIYLLMFAALVAAAVVLAGEAEKLFAEHDSGKITIDEVAGYIAATLFIRPTLATVLASFFLFRLFDVVKLWPASYFDQEVEGGPGVVLDDVVSGFYANLTLRAIGLFTGIC
jgi:phosphatidylglycerophosphatase A